MTAEDGESPVTGAPTSATASSGSREHPALRLALAELPIHAVTRWLPPPETVADAVAGAQHVVVGEVVEVTVVAEPDPRPVDIEGAEPAHMVVVRIDVQGEVRDPRSGEVTAHGTTWSFVAWGGPADSEAIAVQETQALVNGAGVGTRVVLATRTNDYGTYAVAGLMEQSGAVSGVAFGGVDPFEATYASFDEARAGVLELLGT